MHITSGKYRGMKIDGFDIDGTRPTMDRVKESMIGMVQTFIPESICLDLFAGSGQIGLEFLSNGASKCYFGDINNKAIECLKKNILKTKCLNNTEIIKDDYLNILDNLKRKNITLDIIFLDPPYKANYLYPAIKRITDLDILSEKGIIICEYEDELDIAYLTLFKERNYGSKKIKIYRK